MTIEIPIDGSRQLAVHAGMQVDFHTPLYKSAESTGHRIQISEKLAVNPKNIFSFLKKGVGDSVQKGELLAQRKTFFRTDTVVSDVDGTIAEVDHIEGIVLIESASPHAPDTCWFCGEIEAVAKGHITLKIGKHIVSETKHISDECGGQLWFFRDGGSDLPEAPIAVAESVGSYDVAKLEAIGIRGLITTQKTDLSAGFPMIALKNKEVLDEVRKRNLPYCVTQVHHSTIIFYSL